jgi:transcriptional regulator with XRE-family HTH domain
MEERDGFSITDVSGRGSPTVEGCVHTAFFSGFLKTRRAAFGLTQRQLAAKVGVTVTTIQNYESGRLPKGEHLISLARALACSADELLGMAPSMADETRLEKVCASASKRTEPTPLMLEMEFVETALRRSGASVGEIKQALLDCIGRQPGMVRRD